MTKNKVPHCHDLCTDTISAYVWGADLSGAIHGAGGVGGLLAVKRDGAWYVPLYDANGHQKSAKPKGNPLGDRDFIAVPTGRSEERYPATQRQLYVTAYVSETGAVVAEYEYDAFGNTISQSGSLPDTFRHRFSTKPWIAALGAYDYGERLYSPELRRWLSRDPIEEDGGVNLYAMCGNDAVNNADQLGMKGVYLISGGKEVRGLGDIEEEMTISIQGGKFVMEALKVKKNLTICEIKIPIKILYNPFLNFGRSAYAGYYKHDLKQRGGGEIVNPPSLEVFLAHERGHARGFLKYYPILKSSLESHLGSLWGDPQETFFRELKEGGLGYKLLALYANKSTEDWFRENGWIPSDPRLIPNTNGKGTPDLAWRKPK